MQHSIVICIDQNALFRLNLVGKPDYSTGERATANISRDTIQEVIFAAKCMENAAKTCCMCSSGSGCASS